MTRDRRAGREDARQARHADAAGGTRRVVERLADLLLGALLLTGALGLVAGAAMGCEARPPLTSGAPLLKTSAPAAPEPPPAPPPPPLDAGFDAGPDAGHDAGPPYRLGRTGRFFGHRDRPIRNALANAPVAEVTRGHGGRSLSFRITLEDGTEGYFKPEQAFNGMRWSSEIAAFHLDRELGLGRVAPCVARRVAWADLEAAAGGDAREDELAVGEEGTLRGAFVWWVPERLRPLPLPDGWEAWLRIDATRPAVSPFQRPGAYRTALAAATEGARQPIEDPPTPDRPERPAELSDVIVFDYLTQNTDRWGGNNTNLRTVGEGGELMFLDNAAGFVLGRRVPIMDQRLAEVQRFRRRTVAAVRALDVDRLQSRLEDDPLAPALDPRQLAHLEARRDFLVAYVDGLVERYGEDEVLAY